MIDPELAGLEPRPIRTLQQAWLMAQIRNWGRAGFSKDGHEITRLEQNEWWLANKEDVQGWLFRLPATNHVVGYGLLRPFHVAGYKGRWTTSVAILPEFARRGFGRAILRFLVRHSTGEVRATARKDNEAAIHLHDHDYWERLAEPKRWQPGLAYFRAKKKFTGIDL